MKLNRNLATDFLASSLRYVVSFLAENLSVCVIYVGCPIKRHTPYCYIVDSQYIVHFESSLISRLNSKFVIHCVELSLIANYTSFIMVHYLE